MSKFVYISADYALNDGDREVIDELHKWGEDNYHKVDYYDTAQVASGSVSETVDCRPCDLKAEFNRQINKASAVIFVVGDKTASRTAGSKCRRITDGAGCYCTPYKQNSNGSSLCKIYGLTYTTSEGEDIGKINEYSYLKHEFKQAVRKKKPIIILYNSFYHQSGWLPSYMSEYEELAHPFWKYSSSGNKIGDYQYIKAILGYE